MTTPWDEKQNLQKSVHHQPPSAVDRFQGYIVRDLLLRNLKEFYESKKKRK